MVDPNSQNPGIPYGVGQPVLMNPNQPNNPPPALRQPLQTGNARGSSRMPTIEPQKINMMGEGMIRMGSAMGAQQGNGLNAGMAAAGQEYGNIMDYNRAGEAEAFALEEARRVELQRRMDAQAKAKADKKPTKDAIGERATASAKYQNAVDVLAGFDAHDGVVGPWSLVFRKWDQLSGNQRENVRLKIAKLKVDDTLSYVAQSKGAISDREMEVFSSAQPNWTDGEDIWRTWVQDYAEALRVMNDRLAGGSATGSYSDGTSSGNFSPTGQPTGGDGTFSFAD